MRDNTPYLDPLTGGWNLEGFRQQAAAMIQAHPELRYAIWYCDIKRFKYINDVFGYTSGDRLLCRWAQVIREDLQEYELFGRIASDHMAILTHYQDPSQLEARFRRRTAAVLEFLNVPGRRFDAEICSGVYLLKPLDAAHPDVNQMLDWANVAQKSVKSRSGSHMAFFTDGMWQQQLRLLQITQYMREGLASGQFSLYFQPQYDYVSGHLTGAEVLVRWNHPRLGLLSPGDFVPHLEQDGQIYVLDQYVWEQACRYLRRWLDSGDLHPVPLSVNVSRVDILDPVLGKRLLELVNRYGLPPALLRLEITESAYMEEPQQLIAMTRQLRESGFTVEMDDFGSGFSSLNILKDVPVDVLKLDQCFLHATETGDRGGQILGAVVHMAHQLELPVIAEGVDTRERAELLKNMGCRIMQGYYFSHPLTAEAFERLLRTTPGIQPPFRIQHSDRIDPAGFLIPGNSGAFLFNTCIGGALLLEYDGQNMDVLLANDAFFEDTGISRETLDTCRTHVQDLISPEHLPLFRQALDRAGTEESSVCLLRTVPSPVTVEARWLRFRCRQLSVSDHRRLFFLLAEHVAAPQPGELSSRHQIFEAYGNAIFSLFDEVSELDYGGDCLTMLRSQYRPQKVGVRYQGLEEIIRRHAGKWLSPTLERQTYLRFISAEHIAQAYGTDQSESLEVQAEDGRWFRSILFPLSPVRALVCTVSITALKQAEHQMVEAARAESTRHMQRWQETLYQILSELPNMLVFDYDPLADRMTTCLNIRSQGMEPPIEHYLDTLENRNYLAPDSVQKLRSGIRRALADPSSGTIEYRARYFGPAYRWYRAHYASLTDEAGKVYRIVGRIEDIDEVFLREEALRKLAHYDTMTGFLNHDAARHAINAAMVVKDGGTLMVVDLDDFKQVNDLLGHLFGDELLKRTASAIRALFRKEDILGRFGGDEFMIFLPGVHSRQLAENRARDVVDALQKIRVPKLGRIRCSVGLAITQDGYMGIDALFRQADQALYAAKRNGKGHYELYEA